MSRAKESAARAEEILNRLLSHGRMRCWQQKEKRADGKVFACSYARKKNACVKNGVLLSLTAQEKSDTEGGEMKLLFKQRMFSWFDSYDVYREDGSVAYTVEGKLAWGHKLIIYDGALKAILDLAANYPCAGTAFVGWFLLHGAFQRAGEGTKCMMQLWAYLKQSGFCVSDFLVHRG